ncbi:MAG: hypothetical protein HDR02_07335 [Lachnospiraceae bacterium]|nr:hypothetical protein [Lachnospiraceae bacterium]
MFETDATTVKITSANYSSLRQQYLTNAIPASQPDTGSISNGANLQWRASCAPTAVAMLIKTKYSTLVGDTLIDNLATYMGTSSTGSTEFAKITSGTTAYFADRY